MIIAITILAIAIATLVIGFALGVAYRKRSYEQALDVATQTATGIIETDKKRSCCK
ncbi:phosphodiesterase [Ligilactobacillus salivarius SMXD51]|uniref:Phosphodiesterase n=1 Tax=Ligilactobacillus salivarius SMXD51 TaxID=1108963 RepID=H7G0B3_9LACO|nr:phosphodiesterase [Ligilactobacillus salivarius SMXD51]